MSSYISCFHMEKTISHQNFKALLHVHLLHAEDTFNCSHILVGGRKTQHQLCKNYGKVGDEK